MAIRPRSTHQTKDLGERSVRGIFPNVTVVRPSVVFGTDDGLFHRLASLSRFTPVLPLFGGGETLFQPVFVEDVSAAVVRILQDHGTRGRIYELGGPRKMSMREIFSLVTTHTERPRLLVPLPMWMGEIQAAMLGWLPSPPLTRDHLKLLRSDNVVDSSLPGLPELGITPKAAEEVLPGQINTCLSVRLILRRGCDRAWGLFVRRYGRSG